jgi:hypothetical protein
MPKFLVLYHSTVSAEEPMDPATREQAKADMDAWMAWATQARSAIVDLGNPVGNSAKLRGTESVWNGTSTVAGFSILHAASKEKLIALLEDHPHLVTPDAAIEVFEFLPTLAIA